MGVTPSHGLTFPTVQRTNRQAARRQESHSSQSSGASQAGRVEGSKKKDYSFIVVIHPCPPYGTVEGIDTKFKKLRAPTPLKMKSFIQQAKDFKLTFNLDSESTPTSPISELIGNHLSAHLRQHGLAFGELSVTPPSSPSRQAVIQASHRWTVLYAGKKPQDNVGAHLRIYPRPLESLSHQELHKISGRFASYADVSSPNVNMVRNIVFISPTREFIVGPIGGLGSHACLHYRLWNGFYGPEVNEPSSHPECEDCTLSTQTTAVVPSSSSIFSSTIPIDPQLLQISSSRRSSSSGPMVGPSSINLPSIPAPSMQATDHQIESEFLNTYLNVNQLPLAPIIIPAVTSTDLPRITATHAVPVTIAEATYRATETVSATIPRISAATDSSIASPAGSEPSFDIDVDRSALDKWRTNIEVLLLDNIDYDELVSIAAPTADDAASLFYSHLSALLADQPLPSDLPPGSIVRNLTFKSLFGHRLRFSVGEGVGDGPVRSTWAALLKSMVANGHWAEVAPNISTLRFLPGIVSSPKDATTYRLYGLIIRLTLLHGQTILPISPFLLLLLTHGFDTATDSNLITKMAPLISDRLATWPPQMQFNFETGSTEMVLRNGQDPMLLAVDILNLTIEYVRTLSPPSLDVIKKQLTAGLLFATTDYAHLQDHPLFKALKDGFNCDLAQTGSPISFIETFGDDGSALRIVNALYTGRIVTHIKQVIDLILMQRVETILRDDRLTFYEDIGFRSIKRFLCGCGYPTGDGCEVHEDDNANHPLFRAKQFLRALTGSEYLPDERPTIRFVSSFSTLQRMANACGAHIHVCTGVMDFLLDERVTTLLTEEDATAPAEISTKFD
ncbi:hypothetical protein C0992_003380, partial [Termitomyces sp. T32_za158]